MDRNKRNFFPPVCEVTEHFALRSRFSNADIVYQGIADIPVSDLVNFNIDCLTRKDDRTIAAAVHQFFELS